MKRANVRFNYHDYLQLPRDKRYEILDGDLYMVAAPNIRHQRVSRDLFDVLLHHVRDRKLGEVLSAPCDVLLSEEHVVQPDILFIRGNRLEIIREANIAGTPDLIVEILSPGTRRKDLELKHKIYARFGVQEYWAVDPDAATVEVFSWQESGYITAATFGRSNCVCSPQLPDLNLRLSDIFSQRIRRISCLMLRVATEASGREAFVQLPRGS